MITSKQRAELKKIISTQQPVFQIGKESLTETSLQAINDCLLARELIKINALQNCDETPKELANQIAEKLNCEVVAVIGRKIILYKLNPKNTKHVLNI